VTGEGVTPTGKGQARHRPKKRGHWTRCRGEEGERGGKRQKERRWGKDTGVLENTWSVRIVAGSRGREGGPRWANGGWDGRRQQGRKGHDRRAGFFGPSNRKDKKRIEGERKKPVGVATTTRKNQKIRNLREGKTRRKNKRMEQGDDYSKAGVLRPAAGKARKGDGVGAQRKGQ